MRRCALGIILVLLTARTAAGQASAIVVTSCGAIVPADTTGVLASDLACDGASAVVLHHRATLDLNGHRLSGSERTVHVHATTADRSVKVGRWTIRGPGEIAAARREPGPRTNGAACIATLGKGLLTVADVTIRDCQDVALRGGRVRAERVLIADNQGVGISVDWLQATDVVVEDTAGTGVAVGRLDARRLVARRNGQGITASTMRGDEIEATDNAGDGIVVSSHASLRATVATGNAGYGVVAGPSLRLYRSEVTGNDGAPGGVDIASAKRPSLGRTTCDRSVDAGDPTKSFGVCTNDP